MAKKQICIVGQWSGFANHNGTVLKEAFEQLGHDVTYISMPDPPHDFWRFKDITTFTKSLSFYDLIIVTQVRQRLQVGKSDSSHETPIVYIHSEPYPPTMLDADYLLLGYRYAQMELDHGYPEIFRQVKHTGGISYPIPVDRFDHCSNNGDKTILPPAFIGEAIKSLNPNIERWYLTRRRLLRELKPILHIPKMPYEDYLEQLDRYRFQLHLPGDNYFLSQRPYEIVMSYGIPLIYIQAYTQKQAEKEIEYYVQAGFQEAMFFNETNYDQYITLIQNISDTTTKENAQKLRDRIIRQHSSTKVAQDIIHMVNDLDYPKNPFYNT